MSILPNGRTLQTRRGGSFFDHYLKDEDNTWKQTPRVRISVIDPGGEDEVNRVVEAWPPPGYPHERMYLQTDGALSTALPAAEGTVRYPADGSSPAIFRVDFDRDA